MASLFGSILGVANQRQEGQIQGQQTLQQYLEKQQQDAIAARSRSLQEALTQAQIGNYTSEADKRAYDMAHPKPQAPVMGSPEWLKAIEAEAKTKSKYEYHAPRNIDPLSAEGVAAQAQIATTKGDIAASRPAKMDATTKMAHDHYSRAKAASEALDQFGGTLAAGNQASNLIMGHNPLSPALQQANQAGEEFVTLMAPILNKGRTTHIELEQVRKAYVPLASDNALTVAQKAAARKALLENYAPQIHAAQHAPAPAADPLDRFELQ